MLYKGFCFVATLLFVPCVWAQVDEIPFLFADETYTAAPKDITSKQKATTQNASKPIKFSKSNPDQPNLGSNASGPLNVLEVLPPPAPSLKIDLTDTDIQPVQPQKPVNTRTQGIGISVNSEWNTDMTGGIADFPDVRTFELEGFYLGMSPEEVLALAHENNYKVIASKDAVSKFRTGYYESLCKSYGIRAPEKIRACISKISNANRTSYLSSLKIARPKTREFIEFNFSSPATDNRVWNIHYENKGDNSLNFTQANTQRKINRQEAFLNAVFNKFGTPNDPKNYIWGSQNDAFMKVGMYGSNYDAFITLTDTALSDDDFLQAQDWLDENKPFEHFGFED